MDNYIRINVNVRVMSFSLETSRSYTTKTHSETNTAIALLNITEQTYGVRTDQTDGRADFCASSVNESVIAESETEPYVTLSRVRRFLIFAGRVWQTHCQTSSLRICGDRTSWIEIQPTPTVINAIAAATKQGRENG